MSSVAVPIGLPAKRRRALPGTLVGAVILVGASLAMAFFPGLFAPHDPTAFDYNAIMQGPSWAHPFGTDNFGRDMLSRVIHAYRIDMQIAVFATTGPFIVTRSSPSRSWCWSSPSSLCSVPV